MSISVRPRGPELATVLFLSMLAALQFGNAVTVESNPNEHMYVAASVLARSESLYRDFAFLQAPLLPLVQTGVFVLGGVTRFYLAARLISWVLAVITTTALYVLARRVGAGRASAACLTALFATNESIFPTLAEASNYALAMALSVVALERLTAAPRSRRPLVALAVSGLCAGLAVATKLYYLALVLPLAIAALLGGPSNERSTRAGAFGLGVLAGITPLAITAWRAPDTFYFNNLGYHLLNTRWRHLQGQTEGMTLAGKLTTAAWFESQSGALALSCALVIAVVAWLRARRPKLQSTTLLLAALTVVGLATAVTPTPMYVQYWAMHIPFQVLLLAAVVAALPWQRATVAALVGAIVVAIAFAPRTVTRIALSTRGALHTAPWTPQEMHREGEAIARAVHVSGCTGAVATLAPLAPLDASLPIYPELAAGIFVYELADLLDDAAQRRYRVVSPRTLTSLLDNRPPSAIVVGAQPLDARLVAYARDHGYVPHALPGGVDTVYLRPCASAFAR